MPLCVDNAHRISYANDRCVVVVLLIGGGDRICGILLLGRVWAAYQRGVLLTVQHGLNSTFELLHVFNFKK